MWGFGLFNLIPNQDLNNHVLSPTKIASTGDDIGDNGKIKNLTKVILNEMGRFVVVRDEEDKEHLFAWGWTAEGSLGNGAIGVDSKNTQTPTELNFGGKNGVDGEIIKISSSSTSTAIVILDSFGKTTLWAWGNNDAHKLGHEKIGALHFPHKIDSFTNNQLPHQEDNDNGWEIIDLNYGEDYSIITILEDGVLTAYKSGQALGDNGATERFTKIKTPENFELISWKMQHANNLLLVRKNGQKQVFEIGNRGNSDGEIKLYDKYEKILFASDHIKR